MHTGDISGKYKVCILGYSYMIQLARKIVLTLPPSEIEYIVMESDLDSQDACVAAAKQMGCEVFITGGGSAAKFTRNYDLPLVSFRIHDIDYITAIKQAKNIGCHKLGIAYYRFTPPPNLSLYSHIMDIQLIPIIFDNIPDLPALIKQSDCDTIIGATAAIKWARLLGKRGILVYAGEETIREAIHQAGELVKQVYETKRNQAIFHSVLNTSQLGIIITDIHGNIEFINHTMEGHINIPHHQAISLSVQDILPNLPLKKFIRNSLQSSDRYHLINSVMMRCVFDKIMVNNTVAGVIMTFHPNPHNLKNKNKKELFSISPVHNLNNITAHSLAMKKLLDTCKNFSPINTQTVISGPIGSGREEIANCLHNASARSSMPCITIDFATINDDNVIQILYGHTTKNNSTTGLLLAGNGGSIILKNIGLATARSQEIILRALNTRQFFLPGMDSPVTFNIIFYTIITETEFNKLRPDLKQALSILKISVPTLHERLEDIPLLFAKYISNLSSSKKLAAVTDEMSNLLRTYSWPGNILELRSISTRYVFLLNSSRSKSAEHRYAVLVSAIGEANILDDIKKQHPELTKEKISDKKDFQAGVEKIRKLLGYTYNEIAVSLSISRTTLWRQLYK